MPFLFVDYDQGAGGERFCAGISQSTQCILLESKVYENGRTKVLDVFNQEFLKPVPVINAIPAVDCERYTIVPAHRTTQLGKQLLPNVHSIRIQLPQETELWDQIKDQQIKKVLLTQEPTPEYFFGLVKILSTKATDPDFVRKIRYGMLNVEIILLSMGIKPTAENIEQHLQQERNEKRKEPDFEYDLAIPYEDLVYRPDQVRKQILEKFNIEVVGDWLESYA